MQPKMADVRNRVVSGKAFAEDVRIEASVRPASFGDYIGQDRVKENLQIAVENQSCQIEAGASESWCVYGWGSKNPGGWILATTRWSCT